MSEKDQILENIVEKSGKSKDEIEKLVSDKVNELSGLVSEEGAMYIVANELGVRLESEKPKKDAEFTKIEDIKEPKVPVSLVCKVIRKYNVVNFSSANGNEGSVQSMLVGDETGICRVTFWNDKTELCDNIQEGDILKIINAYTRENNSNPDRIDVHYGQYSDIEVNPKDIEVKLKEFTPQNIEFTDKKIEDLEEGDRNVKVTGVVTDFDIPRFYLGCPECFKKVFQDDDKYKCAEHEEVEALKIPIVNVILDDGSNSISVVAFRDRAEKLTESNAKDIISLTEDIDKYKNFSKKIVGAKIELGGNVGLNNLTGDKQVLLNQVLGIEFKDVEEIAEELVEESKEEEKPKKPTEKKEDKKVDDVDDIEIEEIDIDDDLL